MKNKIDYLKLKKVLEKKDLDKRFLIKRSVNIEAYQQKFVEDSNTNLSELVRTVLDELIDLEKNNLTLIKGL